MSTDGYFRIPRRLATAQISAERVAALLWIVSQASYAPREVAGVALDVGETPPIAASEFEKRYRWTRKAVRVFLEYALSDKCAEDTGVRLRIGKKNKGPGLGPGLGPSQGPTYVVRLHRVECSDGPPQGPGLGPGLGQPVVKKKVKEGKTDMGHGVARARSSSDYEPEFEEAWTVYPKRIGNNPKIAAAKAWRSRRKEGVDAPTMFDATRRYSAFCDATSITGTRHTMQAATFFGPDRPYEQEWDIPAFNGNGRNGKHSAPATVNGYQEAPPEVALDLMERIRGRAD